MLYSFLLYQEVNQLYGHMRLPPEPLSHSTPFPSLQVVPEHPAELIVLCSSFLLAILHRIAYIYIHTNQYYSLGLPWWLSGKIGACNAGDMGLIPGSGRFPGGGHSNPLWYSCLENPMDRKNLAGYSPRGHKESDTNEVTEHPHMLLSQSVTSSPSLHPCSQVLSLWGKHF